MVPIDAEIARLVKRVVAGVRITPEAVLVDAIERVGVGGNFLKERLTRERVRAGEHFAPTIGSRLPYEEWLAGGRQETDLAREIVEAHWLRATTGPQTPRHCSARTSWRRWQRRVVWRRERCAARGGADALRPYSSSSSPGTGQPASGLTSEYTSMVSTRSTPGMAAMSYLTSCPRCSRSRTATWMR